MLAELGPDMNVFHDARHAASWAGICPGNRESGGKRLNGRTRKANPYLRRVLCQAAWGASHSKNTYLSALYQRQRGRLGHNQAIFALAHQLLLIAYTLLSRSEDYRESAPIISIGRISRKLSHVSWSGSPKLGFYVTLQPAVTPAQDPPPLSPDGPSSTGANPSIPCSHPLLSASPIRKRGRPCKCAERKIPCKHAAPDNLTS
jgi:Transposase IS116/IS110/IS902 family